MHGTDIHRWVGRSARRLDRAGLGPHSSTQPAAGFSLPPEWKFREATLYSRVSTRHMLKVNFYCIVPSSHLSSHTTTTSNLYNSNQTFIARPLGLFNQILA